jgi:hypothetical protein
MIDGGDPLLLISAFHCPLHHYHEYELGRYRRADILSHILMMSIADKIKMSEPGLWKLNAIYLFNLTLILLFLILPAITGPATKIWWMTISYSTPGAKGDAGGSNWKMGGLGVCKVGDVCTGTGSGMAPAVSGQIKSVLMYHFAGMFSSVFFFFQRKS